MRRSKTLITVSLTLIGLLLTAGVVRADLKANNWVDAFDINGSPVPMYSHSLVALEYNVWIPFWHQLDFDDDEFMWETFPWPNGYPGGCTAGNHTMWEGVMEYALYHVDDGPPGGHGFQETRLWELVHCDRDGDNDFDNDDRKVTPPQDRTTIRVDGEPGWEVLVIDDVVACPTGNCESEIVTTIFVSLDMDCDGIKDTDLTGMGGECFYAEALSPPLDPPLWGGNIQARVTAGGGDQTVNFSPIGLTPVKLSSFTARWFDTSSQPVILWAAVGVLGVAALGVAIWRLRPARR